MLQLAKPELDDTESVYVRVLDRDGVVSTDRGWQAFWTGGDGLNFSGATMEGFGNGDGLSQSTKTNFWRRFIRRGSSNGERRTEETLGVGGAWLIAGDEFGTSGALNEPFLGENGFDGSSGRLSGVPQGKIKRGQGRKWSNASDGGQRRRGYFRQGGWFLPSMANRGSKATAVEQDEERGGRRQLQQEPFRRGVGGAAALAISAGTAARPKQFRDRAFTSSSSSMVSCTPRAPPQAAAPVMGVSVTRWRFIDSDGIPWAHGSPSDFFVTDRLSERSGKISSSHTATLGASEVATVGPSSVSSIALASDSDSSAERKNMGEEVELSGTPLTVQFELVVRSSGRGEMDWWGRGGTDSSAAEIRHDTKPVATYFSRGGSAKATSTAAGDWRVWRSAPDVLALYDALALRFGQEFWVRVSRPLLKTAALSTSVATQAGVKGASSSTSARSLTPEAPHRADILRDARVIGAFLRSLLGLRQFLR